MNGKDIVESAKTKYVNGSVWELTKVKLEDNITPAHISSPLKCSVDLKKSILNPNKNADLEKQLVQKGQANKVRRQRIGKPAGISLDIGSQIRCIPRRLRGGVAVISKDQLCPSPWGFQTIRRFGKI